MKKIVCIFLTLCSIGLLNQSCSKSSEETLPYSQLLVGEWHLTQWFGEVPAGMDIYLSFGEINSFELYQRLESVKYQKFTGSYKLTGKLLTGLYSDGNAWSTEYEIEMDPQGQTLTLTSTKSPQDIGVYTRTTIPADVKQESRSNDSAGPTPKRWL